MGNLAAACRYSIVCVMDGSLYTLLTVCCDGRCLTMLMMFTMAVMGIYHKPDLLSLHLWGTKSSFVFIVLSWCMHCGVFVLWIKNCCASGIGKFTAF